MPCKIDNRVAIGHCGWRPSFMVRLRVGRVSRKFPGLAVALASVVQLYGGQAGPGEKAPIDRPLLDKYCVSCHSDKLKTGGLSLVKLDTSDTSANRETLEKIVRKLRSNQMPPPGMPRPDQASSDKFAATLEAGLDKTATAVLDPGRVVSHR